MSSLYELTGEYLQLLDMLNDEEIDEQMIIDTLEGIDMEFEQKADNYARLINSLENDNEIRKKEIDRLMTKNKSTDKRIEFLKHMLEMTMRATGKVKFKTPFYSFSIAKNGGKRKLTIDKDINDLPQEFKIPQPDKVDSNAIREWMKDNNIEECEFAHLEPQSESLRIK